MAENTDSTRQPTIESVTAENIRLSAENTALQAELAEAKAVIAGQAESLANAEASKAEDAAVIVTYEKQQYRVLGKQFQIKGEVVKATDLGKNKEALKHLVDTKSGLLQLVTKAEVKA